MKNTLITNAVGSARLFKIMHEVCWLHSHIPLVVVNHSSGVIYVGLLPFAKKTSIHALRQHGICILRVHKI